MAFARRRVAPSDAEDVVAETFLVAWRRLESLPIEPLPWLLGIARKVIATRRRGNTRLSNLYTRLQQRNPRPQPTHDLVIERISHTPSTPFPTRTERS
jgi:RNA polymerase sigma-70 factor, ECF subfamily